LGGRQFWCVLDSHSGYEVKVKGNLESRIEPMGMQGCIFEVVVPTDRVVQLTNGRRRRVGVEAVADCGADVSRLV
jgi:transcriptional antiterminator NusG